MLDIRWAARSDIGGRATNQDAWFEGPSLWAVADGMGGHAAGELAARLAIDGLAPLAEGPLEDPDRLVETIAAADRAIVDAGAEHGPAGIGTTLTGVALLDVEPDDGARARRRDAVVFNVGDSRVYRWRDDRLERLTRDHSVVQELIEVGDLTDEEARDDPRRHLITRSLGFGGTLRVDRHRIDVRGGDRFVICSDGLTGELTDDEIADLLAADPEGEPGAVADSLMSASLHGGAADNVTVVVVSFADGGAH